MLNTNNLSLQIKSLSKDFNIDLIGFVNLINNPFLSAYKARYIDALTKVNYNYLQYLSTSIDNRFFYSNENHLNYSSAIVCGFSYFNNLSIKETKNISVISKYAMADDYHIIIKSILLKFVDKIKQIYLNDFKYYISVDSGRISEKSLALASGLGWMGKNSLIINPDIGSFFFIGIILVDFNLDYDEPIEYKCGNCNECINSCPTKALSENHIVDINKCISYLTVENRNDIPKDMFPCISNKLFGCDICQDACPYNKNIVVSNNSYFNPRTSLIFPDTIHFLERCLHEYNVLTKGSSLKRAKQKGLIRNALVNLYNNDKEVYYKYISSNKNILTNLGLQYYYNLVFK